MNIGEKIKQARNEKNISIEKLAELINDNVENIIKYEENELEPTLDKKLSICSALDLKLDDLSFNINTTKKETYNVKREDEIQEEKNENIIDEIEDEIIETPFATSTTTYTEEVFDAVFKKDFKKYCIQISISLIGYILITLYTFFIKMNLFTYIGLAITAYTLIKLILLLRNYRRNKIQWLEQYGNVIKQYDYYKEYIHITSNVEDQPGVSFEYAVIVRVIEKTNYILCMCLANVRTILIIDKKTLDDESLVKVRATLKETCKDYIEQSPERKAQQELTKKEKVVNTLNLITMIIAISSVIIVNIVNKIFNIDATLENNLLIYGITIILPLLSLIMGIVSNKKYNIKSLKNIIVGIIMCGICVLFMGLSFVNHYVLKMGNNDELKEKIENVSTIDLPDYYYTLYHSDNIDNIIIDEKQYKVNSYQVWSFVKKNEVADFEKGLVNVSNWNNYSDYKDTFTLTENAKTLLKSLGYDISKPASYFLLSDGNDSVLNIEDGHYTFMAYYVESDYLLVVDFEILK